MNEKLEITARKSDYQEFTTVTIYVQSSIFSSYLDIYYFMLCMCCFIFFIYLLIIFFFNS